MMDLTGIVRVRLFVIQWFVCIFIDSRLVQGALVKAVHESNKNQQLSRNSTNAGVVEYNRTSHYMKLDSATDNLFYRAREVQNDLFIKTHLSHSVYIEKEDKDTNSRVPSEDSDMFRQKNARTHNIVTLLRHGGDTVHESGNDKQSRRAHGVHSQTEIRERRHALVPDIPQNQGNFARRALAFMLGLTESSLENNKTSAGVRTYNRYRYIKELYAAMRDEDNLLESGIDGLTSLGKIKIYSGYRGDPCLNGGVCQPGPPKSCHCLPGFEGDRCEINIDDCTNHQCQNGGHSTHSHSFRYNVTSQTPVGDVTRAELVIEIRPNTSLTLPMSNVVMNVSIDGIDESLTFQAESLNAFLVFNISQYLHVFRGSFRLTILLSVEGEVTRIPLHRIPLLVIYEGIAHNPLLAHARSNMGQHRLNRFKLETNSENQNPGSRNANERLNKRGAGEDDGPYENTAHIVSQYNFNGDELGPDPVMGCRKYSWNISFTSLSWRSLFAPPEYDAGYCRGECDFPLVGNMNSTSYSFIKNVWRVQFPDDYVPEACCTPVTFFPQSVIFVNEIGDIEVTQLSNMRVATCGCR